MAEGKKILLSGTQPSGRLHIGNYLGALRQFVELQKTHESFFMIADYHALTSVQDAGKLAENTLNLAMDYLAIGIDPEQSVIFKQSDVPEHQELAWIFNCITTMPYLMRAHAFKDAEAKDKELNVGTFNYPMLMAADILLYDASVVPVGQDQKQHVEYARDIAEKFNRVFKEEVFTLPKAYIKEEVAVVPGTDGQKMSKSYKNVIPLFGTKEGLAKAVMSIVTDSSGGRPENVYAIHKLVRSETELAPFYEEHRGSYKALKEALIEDLDRYFAPIRAKYEELEQDLGIVAEVLEKGGAKARAVSEAKMVKVRKAVGVA